MIFAKWLKKKKRRNVQHAFTAKYRWSRFMKKKKVIFMSAYFLEFLDSYLRSKHTLLLQKPNECHKVWYLVFGIDFSSGYSYRRNPRCRIRTTAPIEDRYLKLVGKSKCNMTVTIPSNFFTLLLVKQFWVKLSKTQSMLGESSYTYARGFQTFCMKLVCHKKFQKAIFVKVFPQSFCH